MLEEDFDRERDKVCKSVGKRVHAQREQQQNLVLDKLKAEIKSLRPQAEQLLTGKG